MNLLLSLCLFCLYLCITLREEDKNIFDYCRENNIDHVTKAISSQKVDVNTKDEEVTTKHVSQKYEKLKCTDGNLFIQRIHVQPPCQEGFTLLKCPLNRPQVSNSRRVVVMRSDPLCKRAGENDQRSITENTGHWGDGWCSSFWNCYIMVSMI